MNVVSAGQPIIISPFRPDTGGVDFLGLRQANLDMMAGCIPGINNVTSYVRPYSLVCWIYWKFFGLCESMQLDEPTTDDIIMFGEKVESLFTWAHLLEGSPASLPGNGSVPPSGDDEERVPLAFEAWSRDRTNTSLMAAVNYGPSSKTLGGLGFLEPVKGQFYRPTLAGTALAKALDAKLSRNAAYQVLDHLTNGEASAKEARQLFEDFDVLRASSQEKKIFRSSFFSDNTGEMHTQLDVRSGTIRLIRLLLQEVDRSLDEQGIREGLVRRGVSPRPTFDLPSELEESWLRWFVMQLRQAQRLAFECIFSWLEVQLIYDGIRDPSKIGNQTTTILERSEEVFNGANTVGDIYQHFAGQIESLEGYLRLSREGSELDIFRLIAALQASLDEEGDDMLRNAFRTLFVCARVTELLGQDAANNQLLEMGGQERVSLNSWRAAIHHHLSGDFDEFVGFVIENFIISQHFATAATRFDGSSQRLRFTIEEEGLVPLVGRPWRPRPSPDRLGTCLSLASDCGIIKHDRESGMYTA